MASLKSSDKRWNRIFQRKHGVAERLYYLPERSEIRSTLGPSCFAGFIVGRRLRTTGGEPL
jgi:hypothetical protein